MSIQNSLQENEIGVRLGDLASRVEVASPGWGTVRSGVVRIRRRRRAARAAKAVGGVVAAVALVGSLQVGWLPYPSWAPAVPVSGVDDPTALAQGPTRGSLAADEELLAGVREQVVALPQIEGRGETWTVPSVDQVDVVWAEDLGAERWVLAEAPYRFGLLETRQQVWLVGPAGAPVDQLMLLRGGTSGDAAAQETGSWAGGSRGIVVVVRPGDRDVTLVAPPTLASDGSTFRERVGFRTQDGVVFIAVEDAGEYTVEVDGESVFTSGPGEDASSVAWSGRGTRLAPLTLAQARGGATSSLGLGSMPGSLVWSGGPDGPAMLSLGSPGGARVLVMGHVVGPPPWRTPEGVAELDAPRVSFDVLQVRPSGTDDVAAWQLGATSWTRRDADPPRTRHTVSDVDESWIGADEPTSRIAFVGPDTAVVAELLDGDGAVLQRELLDDGGGSVDSGDATDVRFLSADGTDLGTTPVVTWAAAGGAPQLSP